MAVSRRLRYEILRRDQNRCHYCGAPAPEVKLTIDHVVPKALGGTDDAPNLVAACPDCNSGKSSSSPDARLVADVDELAAHYAVALNAVIEERSSKLSDERTRIQWFDELWTSSASGAAPPRDANWDNSVRRFMSAGLSTEFLERAVGIAMNTRKLRWQDVWVYFCGICHGELREIREQAAKLMRSDQEFQPDAPPRNQAQALVPWANFADHVTTDLFYLLTSVEDNGDFYPKLSGLLYQGMQVMFQAYMTSTERGLDSEQASWSAEEALRENQAYLDALPIAREAFGIAPRYDGETHGAQYRQFMEHVLEDLAQRMGGEITDEWKLISTVERGVSMAAVEYSQSLHAGREVEDALTRAVQAFKRDETYQEWATQVAERFRRQQMEASDGS